MKRITLLICSFFALQGLFAQQKTDDGSVTVIQCSHFSISRPLSEIMEPADAPESAVPWISPDRDNRPTQRFLYSVADGPEYGNDPSAIQSSGGNRIAVATIANWDGQGGNQCPLDPSGAVGLNHYVQTVNANPFKIYNKVTGAAMGTVRNIESLWTPVPSVCCDPVLLYDKYADRWVLTVLGNGSTLYLAVSTTPDPTGTYYTFSFAGTGSYDYNKISIWADGYYMTSNQTPTRRIYCFERAKMILGDASARLIYKTYTPGTVNGFYISLSADADGQLPPAGTPLPFFSYSDNAWGGGEIDGVKMWTMAVDWTVPSAVVTQLPTVPTAAFDASYNSSWNDVYQPGTAQMLDGLGGVCMYRAQWRKWVGYNTVVLNWGVKISTTQRSIKWVELRQDQISDTWSLYQDGIYTPDASTRWMGSIAMDDNGSIALCYAKSSSAAGDYPSLAFTGRLATDPLGTMSFAETIAKQGTSSQPSNPCGNRYGDYAQTSLDPDGLTFWHTGMYTSGGQKSRIYSFQLPIPTGIAENQNASSFSVFQSGNLLNVKGINLLSNAQMVFDLFDIDGKQIRGQKVNPTSSGTMEASMDVTGLAEGAYLVRIGNADFQKVVKVVIN